MSGISIITTALNAAETIRDCLESVKSQTCEPVEHIVIDAASTDGTCDILKEYEESPVKVVSEADNSIYEGMNKGLRLATGDIVGILNADDMYSSPDILEKVARVFEDDRINSCYGDLVYVKADEQRVKDKGFKVVRYWKSGEFDYRKFYRGWMPPHPTFFVRRSVYEKYGLFNLDLGTAADYEIMLRFLVKHGITAAYIPEVLVMMRSGGASNVTMRSRLRANRMDRKAWEVNSLQPYPWTLVMKPLRKIGQWFSEPGG